MINIKELHLDSGLEREPGVKKVSSNWKRKVFQREKAGTIRRKHDWVSGRKVSPEDPDKK